MTQRLADAIGTFHEQFSGRLIMPADQEYDGARSVWNGAIDRRPEAIAQCSTAEEVAAAIVFGALPGAVRTDLGPLLPAAPPARSGCLPAGVGRPHGAVARARRSCWLTPGTAWDRLRGRACR
jgi:hypothetical protein